MVTHEATSIVSGPSQGTQEKRAATITITWVATFSLWNNGGPLVSVSYWVVFLYLLSYKLGRSSQTTKNRKERRTAHKGRSSRLPRRVCTADLRKLTASRCPLHGLPFSLVTLTQVSSCQVNPAYFPRSLHVSAIRATLSSWNGFAFAWATTLQKPSLSLLRTNLEAPFVPVSLWSLI